MLNLSHAIRKFNRFELKYLLNLEQAEAVKSALHAYLIFDEHSNGDGRYPITSLYYDSPDFCCYWEKIDGVKFRRKLRIRYYRGDENLTEDTPVFIEIKQRVNRVTQKRRIVLPYKVALQLCNERQMPECSAQDKPVMGEVSAFLWSYNLCPASIVRYERAAYIGTDFDLGLRVTFDTNLTCQINPLHLHDKPAGQPMLSPDQVVMEIKVNERLPYWLTELVAAQNLKMIRMSKYCRSIEVANPILTHQIRVLSSVNFDLISRA